VFVVCGLSGGTGGGAGPEVARIAAETGGVVVGFGFTPFAFEAPRRGALAEEARELLARYCYCAATVILDNERAMQVAGTAVPVDVALRVADDVLRQAVQGLADLVTRSGPIDADLATVREILTRGGECCLALGVGRGPAAATKAMTAALESPLADMALLSQAPAVLVQVTGGADLAVRDTAAAIDLLKSRLRGDAFMVVGTGCDESLEEACQVTVLGTGLKRPPRAMVGFTAAKYDWRRRAERAGLSRAVNSEVVDTIGEA
jgi:cell division protein FtsZ